MRRLRLRPPKWLAGVGLIAAVLLSTVGIGLGVVYRGGDLRACAATMTSLRSASASPGQVQRTLGVPAATFFKSDLQQIRAFVQQYSLEGGVVEDMARRAERTEAFLAKDVLYFAFYNRDQLSDYRCVFKAH